MNVDYAIQEKLWQPLVELAYNSSNLLPSSRILSHLIKTSLLDPVSWIAGFACKIKADSAYHAELLALLHGLTLAKEKKLIKRIDSQVFAQAASKYVPPLKHIPREANWTADALAELGRKSKDPPMTRNYLYFLDASPSSITNVLERDAIGTTSLRSLPVCMDDPYL